jgi:hypothetical protein
MEAPPQHLASVRLSALVVNLVAIPLAMICVGAFVFFVLLLPHRHPLEDSSLFWFLPGIAVMFVLHELTHAATAMRLAKLPWDAFKFGFNPKALTFYCHCRRPIDLSTYRAVTLAPLFLLVPLSVLLVVLYPAAWLALTAGIHLSGCIGDVWIFTLLREYAADVLVVDHPTEAGCDLYAPAIPT